MMQRLSVSIGVCYTLVTLACDSPTEPSWDTVVPNVQRWVVDDAAAALDANGHFVLPPRADAAAGPVVSPETARELAYLFFRRFAFPDIALGQTFGAQLVQEHGPFDPDQVRVASTTYVAESPYAPLPDSLPSFLRKHLGARYITYYLLGSRVIGTLAGSALNTDLTIENGRIHGMQGGEWRTAVVPSGRSYSHPITPERAVEIVGLLTNALTRRTPRLRLPHRHYSPAFARWELHLDRSVMLVGDSSGRIYRTNVLYVGTADGTNLEQVWVALPEQPGLDTVFYPHRLSGVTREELIRTTGPVLFERVHRNP